MCADKLLEQQGERLEYNSYPIDVHVHYQKNCQVVNPVRSLWTNLPINMPPLAQDLVDAIKNNPESREDFIDWNAHHALTQGRCLCEVRIVTGRDCVDHFRKGRYEEPEGPDALPKNKHWGWFIDPAPRGLLCPMAYTKSLQALGGAQDDFHMQYCKWDAILTSEPTEQWVLKQKPGAGKGTIAGLAVTDMLRPGNCVRCQNLGLPEHMGMSMNEKNFIAWPQAWKFAQDLYDRVILPFKYKPRKGHAKAGLEFEGFYHYKDLSATYGVLDEDILTNKRPRNQSVKKYLDDIEAKWNEENPPGEPGPTGADQREIERELLLEPFSDVHQD
jgi:hypothetical protein